MFSNQANDYILGTFTYEDNFLNVYCFSLTGALGAAIFQPKLPDADGWGCMNGVLSGLGIFIASSNVGAGSIRY